jgi:Zn-dependent protease with chaperone function
MPGAIQGDLHSAGRSDSQPARLTESMGRLTLTWDDGRIDLSNTTRVSTAVRGVPRRLALPDGRVFQTADAPELTAMLRAGGLATPGRIMAWAEIFRPRLAVLLVVLFLAMALGLRWGIPLASDALVSIVPPSVERLVGEQTFALIDEGLGEPSTLSTERKAAIEGHYRRLLAAADLPTDIPLAFRSTPGLGPNAVAFPGGPVLLTDQLVALSVDDGEVAAVLAHEITHMKERHGLKRLARAAGLALAIGLAAGDAGAILEDAAGLPAIFLDRAYSRSFEREADDGAIALLKATGQDPALLGRVLKRLGDAIGPAANHGSWLSTHPGMIERVKRLP